MYNFEIVAQVYFLEVESPFLSNVYRDLMDLFGSIYMACMDCCLH